MLFFQSMINLMSAIWGCLGTLTIDGISFTSLIVVLVGFGIVVGALLGGKTKV